MSTDEMSWSDLIPDVIATPVKVYKHRHKVQAYWKKFLAKSNLGKTNILILGRTNVGKTVFLDCLNGRASDPFYEKPNTSKDSDNEAIKIGDWHSLFRTAPGQILKNRYNVIDNAFKNSKRLEGVIYLVDWGYTYYREEKEMVRMIEVEDVSAIEDLRKLNLERELHDFKKVVEEIRKLFVTGKSISWLLVVLTKTDLFYSKEELDEAEKYYNPFYDGEFGSLLNKLTTIVGKDRLKIDTIPFCAYPEDFEWNSNIIKTKIGQKENQNNLIRNFYSKLIKLK